MKRALWLPLCLVLLPACGTVMSLSEQPMSGANSAISQYEVQELGQNAVEPAGDEDSMDIVSYYHGALDSSDGSVIYDITMYGDSASGDGFYIDFRFSIPNRNLPSQKVIQIFSYNIDPTSKINSIRQGLLIIDINQDGNDDIYMELGAFGHEAHSICFVFDSVQYQFVPVADFDTLASPRLCFSQTGEPVILVDDAPGHLTQPDGYFEGLSKYKVVGTELVLLSKLRISSLGEGAGELCTVIEYQDGAAVETVTDIPKSQFNFDSWGGLH